MEVLELYLVASVEETVSNLLWNYADVVKYLIGVKGRKALDRRSASFILDFLEKLSKFKEHTAEELFRIEDGGKEAYRHYLFQGYGETLIRTLMETDWEKGDFHTLDDVTLELVETIADYLQVKGYGKYFSDGIVKLNVQLTYGEESFHAYDEEFVVFINELLERYSEEEYRSINRQVTSNLGLFLKKKGNLPRGSSTLYEFYEEHFDFQEFTDFANALIKHYGYLGFNPFGEDALKIAFFPHFDYSVLLRFKEEVFYREPVLQGWDGCYFLSLNLDTGETYAEKHGTLEPNGDGFFMFRDGENYKETDLEFDFVKRNFTPLDPELKKKWRQITKEELIGLLYEKSRIGVYETSFHRINPKSLRCLKDAVQRKRKVFS